MHSVDHWSEADRMNGTVNENGLCLIIIFIGFCILHAIVQRIRGY